MKKLTNEAMLITYADSLGKNLKELDQVLANELDGVVGGVHVLPFFPSTGDRGFAPEEYETVDPQFGNWADIEKLADKYYLMFDFMLNHISPASKYFQDFLEKKEKSEYWDMFIKYSEFWPENRPTEADIDMIYKRKDKAPFAPVTFADGTTDQVWNTFGDQQMDLDVTKEVTKKFIKDNLVNLARHGASVIRLDAFAYAIKKLDTNDFFVEPEIWEILQEVVDILKAEGSEVLPEIHEHYKIVRKITEHDMYSYDFALPLITLYSLYSGKTNRIADWLRQSPMKQFTTLDTHDGIGVVDAKDLLTQEETDYTTEEMYKVGANVKKIFSSAAYNNLDIYQVNTTYYSALGNDDASYLLARAAQIFAPGIPQVYYVGLLAGENDIELLESSKEGRNINRHYYDLEEIAETTKRPVVQDLFTLLKFRNTSAAFDLEGSIDVKNDGENDLTVTRTSADGKISATLNANFATKQFTVTENGKTIFATK